MADAAPSSRWKRRVARWIAWPPLELALRLGLALAAPRHRVGAVVVVLDDTGRVLLVEHVFHPGDPWGLPGGWVRHGEDPRRAAARELLEETGLTVAIGAPVHIERMTGPDHVSIAFAGALQGGELRLGAELVRAEWADPDRLRDDLSPFVRRAVAAAVDVRGSG